MIVRWFAGPIVGLVGAMTGLLLYRMLWNSDAFHSTANGPAWFGIKLGGATLPFEIGLVCLPIGFVLLAWDGFLRGDVSTSVGRGVLGALAAGAAGVVGSPLLATPYQATAVEDMYNSTQLSWIAAWALTGAIFGVLSAWITRTSSIGKTALLTTIGASVAAALSSSLVQHDVWYGHTAPLSVIFPLFGAGLGAVLPALTPSTSADSPNVSPSRRRVVQATLIVGWGVMSVGLAFGNPATIVIPLIVVALMLAASQAEKRRAPRTNSPVRAS